MDEIVARGFDRATVGRVLEMVKRNEYKRRQAPPGVRISVARSAATGAIRSLRAIAPTRSLSQVVGLQTNSSFFYGSDFSLTLFAPFNLSPG